MQVIVEGKTGSERVEHYEYARRHLQVLLRQGKDRIPYGPEQQVQCLLLVLIHDRGQIMGQCKNKMEVRDARDHFRLAKGHPSFFVEISAAGAVPVSAGTGTNTDLSTGTAPDQGIAELSVLQEISEFIVFSFSSGT